jgi:hypothetical protein
MRRARSEDRSENAAAADTAPSRKQHRLLVPILVFLPALVLGILLLRYSVDVPFWDQWEPIALVTAVKHGTLTFQDLWRQQNDSRHFFPRLIYIAMDLVGRGDVRYEMLAMFLLAVLVMWNVYNLGLRTLPSGLARSLATVLAGLLIFSPIQWQNWLWGIQVIVFMPVACLTTAVVLCYSDLSAWSKLWVSSVLATMATYSNANGMICWVALLCLVSMQFQSIGARLKAASVWIALAAANLTAYFYDFHQVGGETGKLSDSLELPSKAIRCFLAFLGASLGSARGLADLKLAMIIGSVTVCVAIFVLYKLLRNSKEPGILRRSAGWLAIAGYSLGTAVILTAGRVRMAPKFLLDSRYTAFSLYLLVSLIFLLAIVYTHPGTNRWSKKTTWVVAMPVSAFIVLHILNSWNAIAQMKELRIERLRAKGCLAFLNLVDSPCQASELFWRLRELKQTANALDRLGFLHPGLIKSTDLRMIGGDASSKQYGSLESLVAVGNGFYRASGWAFLPKRSEPADGVLLSYKLPDGESPVFALADPIARGDLADRYGTGYARSGWEQWMKLPAGAELIQAWAYDAIEGHAFPLLNDARASAAPVASIHFKSGDGGAFDGLAPGDPAMAGGWAVLWQKHRPADRVLLTCGPGNALIASGVPRIERPDVVVTFNDHRLSGAGWSIPIPSANVPREGCEVKAWAWDGLTTDATLLTRSHVLSPLVR